MGRFLVCDSVFERHETGAGHPEGADRARVIRDAFHSGHSRDWTRIDPVKAPRKAVERVHTPEYVERVRDASENEQPLDADTPTSQESYETALYAAGSSVELARRCFESKAGGFGVVRPPGHHAEPGRGMGFCLFNNIAIAADTIASAGRSVAIIDIDVHHGNGTQQAFYHRSDVLYISVHQSPLYPGTGAQDETGSGEGAGYTMNIPLSPGSGWSDLKPIWQASVASKINDFAPEMIMVSAGFDAHTGDPVGGLAFEDADYETLAGSIAGWARSHSQGRVIGLLEGGYNRDVLKRVVPKVMNNL